MAERPPLKLLPLVAAACAAMAAWCSMGFLAAVNDRAGDVVRLGLLPPLWLLPLFMGGFVAAAWVMGLSSRAAVPLFGSLVLVLPWIPGHVPGVFLLWSGHMAVVVWIGIAIAMVGARGAIRLQAFHDPHRAPRMAAIIACVLYVASAVALARILPGGDEPHYLIITQSLLNDRDLQIENNHVRGDHLEYFFSRLRPDFLRRGTNGQVYSIHAPGLSALIAPAYALQGYRGVVVFLSIVACIGGALLWSASYRLTGSSGAAWFAWASWALTVPFVFEAFAVLPDGIGATLVLFAVLPLVGWAGKSGEASGAGGMSRARWMATGTALALLPWIHTRFSTIAAMLGLFLVLRLIGSPKGRANVAVFLAVPAVSAAAWFSFFRAIYGTFSPTAPYGGYTQSAPGNILNGLPALLFDQQFGILPNAPVYGFCFVGMVALARRRPRLAAELSLTALVYLLSASAYHMWWAGTSAPARFAVAVLPLLVLPGAFLWESARHQATRALALTLLVVSVAMTAAMVSVNDGQLAYNVRDGYSRLFEWLSPLVNLPQGLPSFFRQGPAGAVGRAGVWIASIVLAWLALRAVERGRPAAGPMLALAAPACLAAAAMVALTAVWRIDEVPGPTPESSERALLEHFDPRIRPTGVNLARLELAPSDRIIERLSIGTPRRRPAPAASTLLLVPGLLPAGQYELKVPNPADAAGVATLVIGRGARPIMSWDLGSAARGGGLVFELPVGVGSLVVNGDADAVRTATGLSLAPVSVVPPADRPTSDYARRVERYGSGLVSFFDDGVFVEEPGFWVRGGRAARIAASRARPGQPLQLFVRNSPEQNQVEIDIDGEAHVLDLQPREERIVPLALRGGRGVAVVRIYSPAGFRPSLVEPGSTDVRYLGVWIELRE